MFKNFYKTKAAIQQSTDYDMDFQNDVTPLLWRAKEHVTMEQLIEKLNNIEEKLDILLKRDV